jgi:hypothetical protein
MDEIDKNLYLLFQSHTKRELSVVRTAFGVYSVTDGKGHPLGNFTSVEAVNGYMSGAIHQVVYSA